MWNLKAIPESLFLKVFLLSCTKCVQHKHLQQNNGYGLYGSLFPDCLAHGRVQGIHHKVNLVDSFKVKLYLGLALACALFPGAQKENQKEHFAGTYFFSEFLCCLGHVS